VAIKITSTLGRFKTKCEGTIKIETSELTFVCPKQGYPDFGRVIVEYIPKGWCLELKSFKLYIVEYRQEAIGYEKLFTKIWDDLVELLEPKKLKLKIVFNPRGNIHTSIQRSIINK